MRFEDFLHPGDRIVTSVEFFVEHHSIVSDQRCNRGKPMLISLRSETGTVCEEPYDDVVRGRETRLVQQQSPLYRDEILEKARSQIGKLRYHLLSQNCEHFANWASGLGAESPQVTKT